MWCLCVQIPYRRLGLVWRGSPGSGMLGCVTSPQKLDEWFREAVSALSTPAARRDAGNIVRDQTALTGAHALELFDAQLAGRHLDLAARWLRSFNEGFHLIGSAGHEANGAIAAAVAPTDPALLHDSYAAFYCARAQNFLTAARDVLRGVVASARDPSSGGRYLSFGSPDLNLIATTDAGAAHLPRAVGLALALTRPEPTGSRSARRWPVDAIVVASFDAGAINQPAAGAAFTAAGWYAHLDTPLPLLLVCEDDSPPTLSSWAVAQLSSRPGLRYVAADGVDLVAVFDHAAELAEFVRHERRPALLHLSMPRLIGSSPRLGAAAPRDPLIDTARLLVDAGLSTPDDVIARYDEVGWQVRKIAEEVLDEPKLTSLADIVVPLAPRRPVRAAHTIAEAASWATGAGGARRKQAFGAELPEQRASLTLVQTINATLTDALVADPQLLIFGANVAGAQAAGAAAAGADRVFDTPNDATTILGLALGAGLAGQLPMPELASLSELHHGGGQLRGEAATMSFRSAGAFRNPMVVRVGGLANQLGYGGHAANDNSVALLRDVPGLVLAVPARAADAAPMLRSCLASAKADGTVCVFLEPTALYQTRDLYAAGDELWLAPYAAPNAWSAEHVPIGRARTYPVGSANDLTILTYANGLRMSLRVAARLATEGYGCRVVDLRWLSPLPTADLVREAAATSRVLIVDETRRSGGVGEGVLAALVDGGFVGSVRRVAAADSWIPPGPAAQHVLVGEDAITQGAHALLTR